MSAMSHIKPRQDRLCRPSLERLKVPHVNARLVGVPDAYPDGGWCIHEEGGVWLVYHSERGKRSGPAIFTSSFDAANFYLWNLGDVPIAVERGRMTAPHS
jgi:hypothetical protein